MDHDGIVLKEFSSSVAHCFKQLNTHLQARSAEV